MQTTIFKCKSHLSSFINMIALQMLYRFQGTPSKYTNFQLIVRCLVTPKYQLATKAGTPEPPKETLPPQKVKLPRRHLSPILKKELHLKTSEVRRFCKEGAMKTLDKYSLWQRLYNLKNLGYEKEEIKSHMSVLLVAEKEIILRRAILEECGFRNITTAHLSRFEVLMRRRIVSLKNCGYIPHELNVPKNILSYAGDDITPPNLSALWKRRRILSSSETVDALPLGDLHELLVLHYLAFFFQDRRIFRSRRLLKKNSLRRAVTAHRELLKLGVSMKQLRMCLQLSRCDSKNLEDLLSSAPKIAGQSIKTIIQKCPKVALCTPSEVRAALSCVQKYGFSEKTVADHPVILTVKVNVLQQGLSLLQSIPDLWALRHCDTVLRLFSQKNVVSKLQYFKSLPKRVVPTVPLLTGSNYCIMTALLRPSTRTPIFDFLRLLSVELQMEASDVKRILSIHPQWRRGSAAEMMETLTLLRSYGFRKEDIVVNLQILLHSRSHVQSIFEKKIYPSSSGKEIRYVPSKTDLALCLYYLEREHKFVGVQTTKEPVPTENTPSLGCRLRSCRQDCLTNPLCTVQIENRCQRRRQKEEQTLC